MLAIREENHKALKAHYPHILEYLEQEDYLKPLDQMVLEPGVAEFDDRKILYVLKDGNEYHLESLYDNQHCLDVWREGVPELRLNAKILLFGMGNGQYIKKLLESTTEDVKIYVFEPSIELLLTALSQYDLSEILNSKRTYLIIKNDKHQKVEEYYYELLDYRDLEGLVLRNHLNYVELFPNAFFEYHNGVQKVVNAIVSTQNVIGRYGIHYYKNTFENMKYFMEGKSLEGLFWKIPKDVPAIVVAAGPSLDKNIMELKKAKGKAFILAVDTALRPLLRNGIRPDMFISIDGNKMVSHFSEEETGTIPMVCYLLSHSALLKKHHAEKFFVNDLNDHIQYKLGKMDKILPVISSGGSVANDAFSIVQALGFTTIIMVGQDLAYTDNKTHASSTVRGELKLDTSKLKRIMVEGVNGDMVASSHEFELYRAWFEEQVAKYRHLHVIDATEGGALIHGTKVATLKDTIEEYCTKDVDFSQVITSTPDFFNEHEKVEMWKYICELPEELERCKKMMEEGIREYNNMLELIYQDRYHSKELKRIFERVKELGDKIEKNPVMYYVLSRVQTTTTEIIKNIYKIEADEKKELISASKTGRDYLELLLKDMKTMIPEVEEKIAEYEKQVSNL